MEIIMGTIKRRIPGGAIVIVAAISLSGCLPLSAPTIISLAIDGISYASTGKTIADHAISGIAERDCSFSRSILNNQTLCDETDVAIALDGFEESETTGLETASGQGAMIREVR